MNQFNIVFPDTSELLDQNEEYFILEGPVNEKIQFHDYQKIYKIPGLYEKIFYEYLKCKSPKVISEMLFRNVEKEDDSYNDLRILDFGAGNGMVAEELSEKRPELVVGVDILEEAKEAAMRDRSEYYTEYLVTDLGQPEEPTIDKLNSYNLNVMVSVAALGFDHIAPKGFVNAFNLIECGGWVAFNLRDKFLTKKDSSGFRDTLDELSDNYVELVDEKSYVHRLSINGESINYHAIVGKKLRNIED